MKAPHQFSREYRRLFGLPSAMDRAQFKAVASGLR